MAEKITTTKKVVKKAPVKKAVAKKAVAKKAPATKVVAKKAVAKAPTKKAVAKKAPVKKSTAKKVALTKTPVKKATVKKAAVKKSSTTKATAKKTAVKKTAVKKTAVKKAVATKATPRTAPARVTFDTLAPVLEPTTIVRTPRPKLEAPAAAPKSASAVIPAPIKKEEKSRPKGLFILVGLVLLGSVGYVAANGDSSKSSSEPTPVASPSTSAIAEPSQSPTPEPSVEPSEPAAAVEALGVVTASYSYTSTGIRLVWNVEGDEVEAIQISSAENKNDFLVLTSVTPDVRSLRIIKTDTKGWTKFKVTVQPLKGDEYSTTVGLRGRFTL